MILNNLLYSSSPNTLIKASDGVKESKDLRGLFNNFYIWV